MANNTDSSNSATITAAIIGGIFACIVAVIGLGQPFIAKYADLYFATSVPTESPKPLLPEPAMPTSHNLAFVDFNDGTNDIYVSNEDGGDEIRLTAGAFIDDYPAWSPDGRYLAFQSGRNGNVEIYVMDSTGAGLTNITKHDSYDANPSWSADGQKIVFVSDRTGNQDLFTVDVNTGQVRQISNIPDMIAQCPDWSPDGLRIVVMLKKRLPEESSQLYVMNADGSGLKQITTTEAKNITPAWSPNGKYIAFSSMPLEGGVTSIYRINADGSGLVRLTSDTINATDPDWSPDGQKIIFWGIESNMEHTDLYIVNFDGTGLTNITNTPSRQEYGPTWAWK